MVTAQYDLMDDVDDFKQDVSVFLPCTVNLATIYILTFIFKYKDNEQVKLNKVLWVTRLLVAQYVKNSCAGFRSDGGHYAVYSVSQKTWSSKPLWNSYFSSFIA